MNDTKICMGYNNDGHKHNNIGCTATLNVKTKCEILFKFSDARNEIIDL